ncbi:hypothetical protein DPMN_041509 [Dreissena polymorpha]|uniref:Uncharacterized protein n=1 Tax=Dreissena polymorpha TaxID=45954 RepID=A0A9D4D0B9_DREPO|nr:hypothetical protein DPMN_041509 [Dreissena polymorpha]
MKFVKEGQTDKKARTAATSIFDESDRWEMKVDLGKQLVFPDTVHTTQRPGIVI